MNQLPPERSPGKIELTGRMNQMIPVVRALGMGAYGIVDRSRASGGSGDLRLLYIDSARTAGEVYKAYIVNLASDVFSTTSGSFSLAGIGNITDATEVTALNAQEGDGSATHYLTDAPQRLRLVLGYRLPCVDDAGRACYLIVAKDFEEECGAP